MTLASAAPAGRSGGHEYAHDWALVDVETSGLVARRDRVLSVAVVTVGPDGNQTGEFSTLLNPGCDPGPVEVHGLTAERLRGAPRFEDVAGRIGGMLKGRVLVAHNAQFDYEFLAHEFARARSFLPVERRLCTLALNRSVDPPTCDLKLGTLAAHYGIPQQRAHDALDDTRVLAGVLRSTLREAGRLGLALPFVACPPRQDVQWAPQPPKTPCAYRNPGRFPLGGPLTQGMKVAFTGETTVSRAELTARAVAAGLNVMGTVSGRTSLVVTNDRHLSTAKARRGRAESVPFVDEAAFLALLPDVRPGTRHDLTPVVTTEAPPALVVAHPAVPETAPATDTVPAAQVAAVPRQRKKTQGPLAGRRVLVLGGSHPNAVAARSRVVELGGAAAVNLSARVTDVIVLSGGRSDRRMRRIAELDLPTYDVGWLDEPTAAPSTHTGWLQSCTVLPRGAVVDLPCGPRKPEWNVTASWAQQTACDVDVVAFVLDEDDQVSFDDDFVFYGAPENPAGTVRLLTDGPAEQTVTAHLAALPPSARKVVIAAAIDGAATFGDVGAVQISAGPGSGAAPLVQATLDAATTERTLLLAEIYRRGPVWRLRAVGQGYDHGLGALARSYGVEVDE